MSSLTIRQLTDSGGTNDIAPTTVPQAVMFPDGSNLNTTIGSIATIETSPSTHAYAVGDFLVWNGQLYRVTAAIAIGESLTVGTNIVSTKVGDLLTIKTGTVTLNGVQAGSYRSETVQLTGFTTEPLISIMIDADASTTGVGCSIRNPSATSFTVYASNSNTDVRNIKIRWYAIGK